MLAVVTWAAPNGRMYLVCGCADSIYFVDPETGEIDEARTLKGHTEVRIMRIVIVIIAVIIPLPYSIL